MTPIISLWMPWANWVMLGWKTIETRKHKRLATLVGKRIGIHAALKWDDTALQAASPYLQPWQVQLTEDFLRIGGAIIGTVEATSFFPLTVYAEEEALIECRTIQRYGLTLVRPQTIAALPCRGKQGIWYHEIPELAESALTSYGERK